MPAIVTVESVAAVAAVIRARGERPTVQRVRVELGGGSPNDILPLLNQWKDAQRVDGAVRPEPTPEPAAAEVADLEALPLIGQALDGLQGVILGTVNALIERERATAASAQQAIQAASDQKVALARQAADQQVADVIKQSAVDIADAREEAIDLASQLSAVEGERDRLGQELAEATTAGEALRAQLVEVTAARDTATTALAAAAERAKAAEAKAVDLEAQLAETKAAAKAEVDRLATVVEQIRAEAVAERQAHDAALADVRAEAERQAEQMRTAAATAATAHQAEIERLRADNDQVVAALRADVAKGDARANRAEERADATQARADAAQAKVEKLVADLAAAGERAKAVEGRV